MLKLDEDLLICDLAETYQIFDYKQLPLKTVAVLSSNLRDDSRIKMKMNNQKVPFETSLLAGISDALNLILWSKSKDGQKNKNRPKSITDAINQKEQPKKDALSFNSGSDFEKAKQEIIGGD